MTEDRAALVEYAALREFVAEDAVAKVGEMQRLVGRLLHERDRLAAALAMQPPGDGGTFPELSVEHRMAVAFCKAQTGKTKLAESARLCADAYKAASGKLGELGGNLARANIANADHAVQLAAKDQSIAGLIDLVRQGLTKEEAAEQRAEAAEAMLVECYRISGADTTHASTADMAKRAVKAVADLRRDYDEAGAPKRAEAAMGLLRFARNVIRGSDVEHAVIDMTSMEGFGATLDREIAKIAGGAAEVKS